MTVERAHRCALAMLTLAVTSLASCATVPRPVPVIAGHQDAVALAGSWEGDYQGADTRRNGDIRFFLSANADSAVGDVVMFTERTARYAQGDESRMPTAARAPRILAIRFVMAYRDTVYGVMEPYRDSNGSVLLTQFAGILRSDWIRGTYRTRNLDTSEITEGEWSVRRRP